MNFTQNNKINPEFVPPATVKKEQKEETKNLNGIHISIDIEDKELITKFLSDLLNR